MNAICNAGASEAGPSCGQLDEVASGFCGRRGVAMNRGKALQHCRMPGERGEFASLLRDGTLVRRLRDRACLQVDRSQRCFLHDLDEPVLGQLQQRQKSHDYAQPAFR